MGDMPLVVDATSDIFSRTVDFSKLGVVFAGMQKNLGPAGTALVIVRDDLVGHAMERTPSLLDWSTYVKNHSLANTNSTFNSYVMSLVMQWLKDEGGTEAMGRINEEKAQTLYQVIDSSGFYRGTAHPDHRSRMNATCVLPNEELTALFLQQALANGLYALKGHKVVGGIRASIYNAVPLKACLKLAEFMREFERTHG